MKLIVESGATKTDWRLVADDGSVRSASSAGLNPSVLDPEQMNAVIGSVIPELNPEGRSVSEIYFYGAGLVDDAAAAPLAEALEMWCPFSRTEFHSDMLAAARALFGDGSGVVAIMGTGSNSCLYENGKIVRNIRPGGFILGDEGSGAALGRALISDFVKGLLPGCLESEFVEKYGFTKITKVIEGGAERYLSVWEALKGMDRTQDGYVFIHDGARPFVSEKIIEDTYKGARDHGGAVAAMPVKDTIKIADEEGFAKDTPNRKSVWMVQTPQVFERGKITEAYEKMIESLPVLTVKGVQITDDAMVMETMTGEKVKLVEASYENIKITTPEDMKIAECLL